MLTSIEVTKQIREAKTVAELNKIVKQFNMKHSKELILAVVNELEIKADHYSRADWEAYQVVKEQLTNLDKVLLNIYDKENVLFLKQQKQA